MFYSWNIIFSACYQSKLHFEVINIELQNLQPSISQLKNLRIYFQLNFMLTLKHNIYLIHQNAMPQGIVQTYVIDQTYHVPGTCKMQHMFNKFKGVWRTYSCKLLEFITCFGVFLPSCKMDNVFFKSVSMFDIEISLKCFRKGNKWRECRIYKFGNLLATNKYNCIYLKVTVSFLTLGLCQ